MSKPGKRFLATIEENEKINWEVKMVSIASAYAGVVGAVCIVAAFKAAKFPKFQTEAFKAKPAEEQRRSIRNMRMLFTVFAILCFGFSFAIGFIQGYTGAKTNRVAMQTWVETIQSENALVFADLNRVEQSMENVMVPERIVTSEGIAEARKRLADWNDAISRFEAGKRDIIARAEAAIPQLDLPQSERDATLAGFHRGVDGVKPISDEFIRAKRDVIAAAGQKLDLLQARMGQVTVKNGELSFANPADTQSNAAIDARINKAAEREEAAANKLNQRALSNQQKIDQGFKN